METEMTSRTMESLHHQHQELLEENIICLQESEDGLPPALHSDSKGSCSNRDEEGMFATDSWQLPSYYISPSLFADGKNSDETRSSRSGCSSPVVLAQDASDGDDDDDDDEISASSRLMEPCPLTTCGDGIHVVPFITALPDGIHSNPSCSDFISMFRCIRTKNMESCTSSDMTQPSQTMLKDLSDQFHGMSNQPQRDSLLQLSSWRSLLLQHQDTDHSSLTSKEAEDGGSQSDGSLSTTTIITTAASTAPAPSVRIFAYQNEQWLKRYEDLRSYFAQHGHSNVPYTYKVDPGLSLWVKRQKHNYQRYQTGQHSCLTAERIGLLNRVCFDWDSRKNRWAQSYQRLQQFVQEHGHYHVPAEYNRSLCNWVKRQKTLYRLFKEADGNELTKCKLSKERAEMLSRVGFM